MEILHITLIKMILHWMAIRRIYAGTGLPDGPPGSALPVLSLQNEKSVILYF